MPKHNENLAELKRLLFATLVAAALATVPGCARSAAVAADAEQPRGTAPAQSGARTASFALG